MPKPETTAKTVQPELSSTAGWVIFGAFLGSLLVIAHVALEVFELFPGWGFPLHPSNYHKTDRPFSHILAEFAIYSGGSAVVFGLISVFRSRWKRR